MIEENETFSLTEAGKAVYYAFIEAYKKKHPEATEEQAVKAIREELT